MNDEASSTAHLIGCESQRTAGMQHEPQQSSAGRQEFARQLQVNTSNQVGTQGNLCSPVSANAVVAPGPPQSSQQSIRPPAKHCTSQGYWDQACYPRSGGHTLGHHKTSAPGRQTRSTVMKVSVSPEMIAMSQKALNGPPFKSLNVHQAAHVNRGMQQQNQVGMQQQNHMGMQQQNQQPKAFNSPNQSLSAHSQARMMPQNQPVQQRQAGAQQQLAGVQQRLMQQQHVQQQQQQQVGVQKQMMQTQSLQQWQQQMRSQQQAHQQNCKISEHQEWQQQVNENLNQQKQILQLKQLQHKQQMLQLPQIQMQQSLHSSHPLAQILTSSLNGQDQQQFARLGSEAVPRGGSSLQEGDNSLLFTIGTGLARHGISVAAAAEAGWLGAMSNSDFMTICRAYEEEENRKKLQVSSAHGITAQSVLPGASFQSMTQQAWLNQMQDWQTALTVSSNPSSSVNQLQDWQTALNTSCKPTSSVHHSRNSEVRISDPSGVLDEGASPYQLHQGYESLLNYIDTLSMCDVAFEKSVLGGPYELQDLQEFVTSGDASRPFNLEIGSKFHPSDCVINSGSMFNSGSMGTSGSNAVPSGSLFSSFGGAPGSVACTFHQAPTSFSSTSSRMSGRSRDAHPIVMSGNGTS